MTTDRAPTAPTAPIALIVAAVRRRSAASVTRRGRPQQAYMKSAMPYRGITSPGAKALLRPLFADPALVPASREEWESSVRGLWDGATHREERYAAIALTGHRAARVAGSRRARALPVPRGDGRLVDLRRRRRRRPRRADPVAAQGHRDAGRSSRMPSTPTPWVRRTAILAQLTHRADTDEPPHRGARREPRGVDPRAGVLHPQGGVGAAPVRAHRPGLGAGLRRQPRARLSGLSRREAPATLTGAPAWPGTTQYGEPRTLPPPPCLPSAKSGAPLSSQGRHRPDSARTS